MSSPVSLDLVLRQLYDSEIGCAITIDSLWDRGWRVRIGDEVNGYVAEQTFRGDEFDQIAAWLIATGRARFPGSQFAKIYRGEG